MDEGKIAKSFEKVMTFLNDTNRRNIFTLAIERKNIKIILEVMKSLTLLPKDQIATACETIPLIEVMKQRNFYVVTLLKKAMVLAISDRGQPPPLVFKQA